MKQIAKTTLLALAVFLIPCLPLAAQDDAPPTPAQRLDEMRTKAAKAERWSTRLQGLLDCARYAGQNGLADESEDLYREVLAMDPFHPVANKQVGNVKLMEVWVSREENEEFQKTLKEEKADDNLKALRKGIFNNNVMMARQTMEQFTKVSQTWVIETAYGLVYRTNDQVMETLVIKIFGDWAGARARALWFKRINHNRHPGTTLQMLEYLKLSITDDPADLVVSFALKEVLSQRNETFSMKCLEILESVDSQEIAEALRKFMPRCNNQVIKAKLMQMLY